MRITSHHEWTTCVRGINARRVSTAGGIPLGLPPARAFPQGGDTVMIPMRMKFWEGQSLNHARLASLLDGCCSWSPGGRMSAQLPAAANS